MHDALNNHEQSDNIQVGDYIIIQRQKYTKLQKFSRLDTKISLGRDQLELSAIEGQPYYSTFKMCPKGGQRRSQRLFVLERCSEAESKTDIRDALGIHDSGTDNRNIKFDNCSQMLNTEDIEQLRDECTESTEIIGKIVENSKTFHEKTEYSQLKYLLKKEKKYCDYVQIRKPTVRLIAAIFYRQDPEKVMGMRMDTLSQLISYAGVCAYGSFLMYESGSNGLLPASVLNSMGADTTATLVHMHPGNVPQMQALYALNLPPEQRSRCISVNIYSVLRAFYQANPPVELSEDADDEDADDGEKATMEPDSKRTKLNENTADDDNSRVRDKNKNGNYVTWRIVRAPPSIAVADERQHRDDSDPPKTNDDTTPKWKLENGRACALMRERFDSLVIACKEHPATIVKALLPFVKPSRPVVVYSEYKEALIELFMELKTGSDVINVHLTSNWLRMYQILPDRTHPEVNMTGNSGFLLWCYTVK